MFDLSLDIGKYWGSLALNCVRFPSFMLFCEERVIGRYESIGRHLLGAEDYRVVDRGINEAFELSQRHSATRIPGSLLSALSNLEGDPLFWGSMSPEERSKVKEKIAYVRYAGMANGVSSVEEPGVLQRITRTKVTPEVLAFCLRHYELSDDDFLAAINLIISDSSQLTGSDVLTGLTAHMDRIRADRNGLSTEMTLKLMELFQTTPAIEAGEGLLYMCFMPPQDEATSEVSEAQVFNAFTRWLEIRDLEFQIDDACYATRSCFVASLFFRIQFESEEFRLDAAEYVLRKLHTQSPDEFPVADREDALDMLKDHSLRPS